METTARTDSPADPAAALECQSAHGYIKDKNSYLGRLKDVEGQARGIHKLVEDETYCIDILGQISAVTKALERVALGLLDDHLKHCVIQAAHLGGEAADSKIKQATDAVARFIRS